MEIEKTRTKPQILGLVLICCSSCPLIFFNQNFQTELNRGKKSKCPKSSLSSVFLWSDFLFSNHWGIKNKEQKDCRWKNQRSNQTSSAFALEPPLTLPSHGPGLQNSGHRSTLKPKRDLLLHTYFFYQQPQTRTHRIAWPICPSCSSSPSSHEPPPQHLSAIVVTL